MREASKKRFLRGTLTYFGPSGRASRAGRDTSDPSLVFGGTLYRPVGAAGMHHLGVGLHSTFVERMPGSRISASRKVAERARLGSGWAQTGYVQPELHSAQPLPIPLSKAARFAASLA